MSRKWQRVQRWDAEHLVGPLAPARWVLHAFSSISLAVVLLVIVAAYGALASIPIGLVALAPTWLVVALTAAAAVAAGAGLLALLARLTISPSRPGWRFAATVFAVLLGGVGAAWGWYAAAWPALRYEPATGGGLRFFAGFVDAYSNTTLRRLPGVEMTELEFYSWWPLRIVLLLFVINMVVATIRRIEFTFKNLGVLTVHTGIVVIALGSVYYQGLKREGDALLRAGMPNAAGEPSVGPRVRGFYDNTRVALWVAQHEVQGSPMWEARPLSGVPRYNDYALDASLRAALPEGVDAASVDLIGPAARLDPGERRDLSLRVPDAPAPDPRLGFRKVDEDIGLRIVGYAEYAELDESLAVLPEGVEPAGTDAAPVRVVELLSRVPDESGVAPAPDTPAFSFTLRPDLPATRVASAEVLGIEYAQDLDPGRLADLAVQMPRGVAHALVIEIPSAARDDGGVPRVVVPARPGVRQTIGETGWRVGVKELHPTPPFPIITEGYQGATSSVAVVEITTPDGETYDRWVYHRFPEINQDLLPTQQADGRPSRRDADPAIRVAYVDASKLQLYFNERTGPGGGRTVDLLVREPAGPARLIEGVEPGEVVRDVMELIDFRVARVIDNAVTFQHPVPVPEADRDNQLVGTHSRALLAVEVSADDVTGATGRWSTVVWVPFLQYLGTDPEMQRTVDLPGGRSLTLQFGRVWHGFPGFVVQLLDFEMIAYDHRGAPRDYQSMVRVSPNDAVNNTFEPYDHVTKLNAPLTAPFIWSDERSLPANVAMRLTSGLNPRQFKLSQAGWDQQGWTQTQRMADQGQLPRPFARYTILQVGNNPGIHIIAFGGVLMAVGIPWAFYVKPWLVRREKARLAAAARNTTKPPAESADSPRQTPRPDAAQQEGAAPEPARQA